MGLHIFRFFAHRPQTNDSGMPVAKCQSKKEQTIKHSPYFQKIIHHVHEQKRRTVTLPIKTAVELWLYSAHGPLNESRRIKPTSCSQSLVVLLGLLRSEVSVGGCLGAAVSPCFFGLCRKASPEFAVSRHDASATRASSSCAALRA